MIATMNFAGLVLAAIFTAVAAVLCNWLLLRVMFHLMRPAAVRKPLGNGAEKLPTVGTEIARGTAELARALAPSRPAI